MSLLYVQRTVSSAAIVRSNASLTHVGRFGFDTHGSGGKIVSAPAAAGRLSAVIAPAAIHAATADFIRPMNYLSLVCAAAAPSTPPSADRFCAKNRRAAGSVPSSSLRA